MGANSAAPATYASIVREHYEELPYPYRDPEKELENLSGLDGLTLDAFTHMGWGGKRDLRDGARILVAGCGTGDALMFLGEQLRGSSTELVAIDLSVTSLKIAQARLDKRQLGGNITLQHCSILDLPNSGLGAFDVIDCSGVLHHPPDPAAGLAALAAVLKDDGILGIMVYGQYGRMSIYLVQQLMRQLTTVDMTRAEKIVLVREFLNNVPESHWLTVKNERFLHDILFADGSGIYDLFLHDIDRAYTVPQLYEWVQGVGLTLFNFFSEFTNESAYLPNYYSAAPALLKQVAAKPLPEQHAIAELMHGNMYKHHFYATKQPKESAIFAQDMVIAHAPMQSLFLGQLYQLDGLLEQAADGQTTRMNPCPVAGSPPLMVVKQRHTRAFLQLINGQRTIGEMIDQVVKQSGDSPKEVEHQLQHFYEELRARQLVFLRHHSVAPYITAPQIFERMKGLKQPA